MEFEPGEFNFSLKCLYKYKKKQQYQAHTFAWRGRSGGYDIRRNCKVMYVIATLATYATIDDDDGASVIVVVVDVAFDVDDDAHAPVVASAAVVVHYDFGFTLTPPKTAVPTPNFI